MAYQIPVAILLVDHAAAAALVSKPANFFDDESNDRWSAVEDLSKITNAPIEYFATEDMSVFYLGVRIEDDWCIEVQGLAAKAVALKMRYPHPLIQSATLAVVSEFC